eukprot:scaffold33864_cov62-Isochrysis_galbana.AAC.1
MRSSHSILFAAADESHLPAAVETAPPPSILSLPSVPTTIFLQPVAPQASGEAPAVAAPPVTLKAALCDPAARRPLLVAVGLGVGNNLIMVQ